MIIYYTIYFPILNKIIFVFLYYIKSNYTVSYWVILYFIISYIIVSHYIYVYRIIL